MKKILMLLAVAACMGMTSCACGGDKKGCDNENCPNKEQCTDCKDCNGECGNCDNACDKNCEGTCEGTCEGEGTETPEATATDGEGAVVDEALVEQAQLVEGAAEN